MCKNHIYGILWKNIVKTQKKCRIFYDHCTVKVWRNQKGKQAIIWRTEWQKDNNGQQNTTEKTNVLETLEDPGAFEGQAFPASQVATIHLLIWTIWW